MPLKRLPFWKRIMRPPNIDQYGQRIDICDNCKLAISPEHWRARNDKYYHDYCLAALEKAPPKTPQP